MSTYKVLQDIEAEDKFLGPLTLRQFIYGAVTALAAYISFLGLTKGTWVIAAILSPIIILGSFLTWPWKKDQPTEVWLLAKIRFFLKPRRRIWDQSGIKQLVTITVPKKAEPHLTNGLSQLEVQSRLKALAQTIDSRGWAIKNVQVNLSVPSSFDETSDRLIDPATLPQAVPTVDVRDADDILDEQNNPTAHHFDTLITKSTTIQKQQAVTKMQQAVSQSEASTADKWFVSPDTTSPSTSTPHEPSAIQPQPKSVSVGQPTMVAQSTKVATNKPQATSTLTPDPAILNLARNDDLNVATLARQAQQVSKSSSEDEVVISLR